MYVRCFADVAVCLSHSSPNKRTTALTRLRSRLHVEVRVADFRVAVVIAQLLALLFVPVLSVPI
jgi:hypothetical protein